MARISPAAIKAGIDAIRQRAPVDAVFVSCNQRAPRRGRCRNRKRHRPAGTSSNHAMAWHALRLAGVEDRLPQFGSLFTLPATA